MESHLFKPFAFTALTLQHEPGLEDVINDSENDNPSYSETDFGLNDGIIGGIRNTSGLKCLVLNISKTYKRIKPQFDFQEENNPRRNLTVPCEGVLNNNRDNKDHNLIVYVQDEIKGPKNTYCIEDLLGQGISGQVFRARCINNDTQYALKIIKNRKAFLNQALIELKILEMLNKDIDKNDQYHIIRTIDYFYYYDHLCIVFELLNDDLYQLLKKNHLQGISLSSIRFIIKQMLEATEKFHSAKIIHCDLKPENILLKIDKDNPKGEISIKITDFGSACSKGHAMFKYIQSRYYRAPEVIIGLPYSTEIDIWSIGCIAAELYIGGPLLPGSCEFDQLQKITELLGDTPDHLVFNCRNFKKYFCIDPKTLKPLIKTNEVYYKENPNDLKPKYKIPFGLTSLDDLINIKRDIIKKKDSHNSGFSFNSSIGNDDTCAFIHFLKGILNIDPKQRWNAKQCLRHPFITKEKLDNYLSFCPNEISQFMYLSGDTTQFMNKNGNGNRYNYNPYHSMVQAGYNQQQQGNRMSTNTHSYSNCNISLENNNVFQPNLQNIQMKWLKNFPYAMVDQCNMLPNQNVMQGRSKCNNTYMETSFEKINMSNEQQYYYRQRQMNMQQQQQQAQGNNNMQLNQGQGQYYNFDLNTNVNVNMNPNTMNRNSHNKRPSFNTLQQQYFLNKQLQQQQMNAYNNKTMKKDSSCALKAKTDQLQNENDYEGLVPEQHLLSQSFGPNYKLIHKRTLSQSDFNNKQQTKTGNEDDNDNCKETPITHLRSTFNRGTTDKDTTTPNNDQGENEEFTIRDKQI